MKVLFVCHGNVGRSQTAMEYFNLLSSTNDSDSAGVQSSDPTVPIGDIPLAQGIVQALLQENIDIRKNLPKQISETMTENFDRLIVMCKPSDTPTWLKENSKYTYWPTPELKATTIEQARQIRNDIKSRVSDLVKEIG